MKEEISVVILSSMLLVIGMLCIGCSRSHDTSVKHSPTDESPAIIVDHQLEKAVRTGQRSVVDSPLLIKQQEQAVESNSCPSSMDVQQFSYQTQPLPRDRAHMVALGAVQGVAGISNATPFKLHIEKHNQKDNLIVTFMGPPLPNCEIDNYISKVVLDPTNGQVKGIIFPPN